MWSCQASSPCPLILIKKQLWFVKKVTFDMTLRLNKNLFDYVKKKFIFFPLFLIYFIEISLKIDDVCIDWIE